MLITARADGGRAEGGRRNERSFRNNRYRYRQSPIQAVSVRAHLISRLFPLENLLSMDVIEYPN